MKAHAIYLILNRHYLVLACGIYTQTNIEKNFRMSFLVRKVIAFNEHHQKRALQRAKVLVHNILPDEIIPMYALHLKCFSNQINALQVAQKRTKTDWDSSKFV